MADLTVSSAVHALLGSASQISMRSNLGLGSLATQSANISDYVAKTVTVNGQALSSDVSITTITGNAGTATALETARNINGVAFDGTGNITVTAAAGTLTGTTLAANIVSSSLTSVGTLDSLTVTNPINGDIAGNADTADSLSAPILINGISFDGSENITVAAAASTLTGNTLAAGVTASSLTSVGTLAALTVTAPISGSLAGNASTATALATGRTISVTGDLAYTSPSFDGSGNVTAAGTLATVNANVGSFGGVSPVPNFTVNAKGLITAAGTNAVVAPAGTLSGSTLAAGVTGSSLTSVGTLTVGTWAADTIPLNKGGTGQTTAAGVRTVLGLAPPSTNIVDASGTRTLALTDINQKIEFTHATATSVTIPQNTTVDWTSNTPVPEIYIQRGASAGPVTVGGSGVVINNNTSAELPAGRYGVLRWKSNNVWDWMGGSQVAWADITSRPVEICVALSDETTALTAGTSKVTIRAPFAFTLTSVKANVNTAPTGAAILVDINESGTTLLSTKLMIDATEKTSVTAATPYVISDAAIADDAEISFDIDQIGSTVAGAGLKVWLIGTR